ncbi:ATP-dependent zinc metalloprotease FtsH [Trichinella pseudospiralis]
MNLPVQASITLLSDPAIEQRSATFAGTDKSLSESSSAVLTRDLLSATVSVFSSPGQMIRVVSHPEELFHADLFIPKLRYSSANMSRI